MLHSLRLVQFRAYRDERIAFKPGVNIITGSNGSGKTTILEAIHLFSANNSFRSQQTALIGHGHDWARLEAETGKGNYTMTLTAQPWQKQLTHNGSPVRTNPLQTVLFEPEQLRILHGPPDLRRQWLDQLIASLRPQHSKHLAGYQRALRQRNALLLSGRFSQDDVFVWDMKLAEYGAAIVSARQDMVARLQTDLALMYEQLSGYQTNVAMSYLTPFSGDYANQFFRALSERLEIDRQRGYTTRGPHREDISFTLNEQPVAETASRGERRTIYLALKLLEHQQRSQVSQTPPALLLDDIFAEFDQKHKELITHRDMATQVFITSVDSLARGFPRRVHHIRL